MAEQCLNCGKPIKSVDGRRKKIYCDHKCRSAHYAKTHLGVKKYVLQASYDKLKAEYELLKRELEELKQLPKKEHTKPKQAPVTASIPEKTAPEVAKNIQDRTGKHKLWTPGDPKENTMAFMKQFGVMNYAELEAQE